jgi:lysophospholipase L1-like esterase
MKVKLKIFFQIFLATIFLTLVVDQLLVFYKGGVYASHYNYSDLQRSPYPYIEFKGKPNVLDHNKYGYRWEIDNIDNTYFNIAFFGGSTGYGGNPPIPLILEKKLRENFGKKIKVANFSVVSSNHRQHLHNLIESNDLFEPDLIIFYGGYNETGQVAFYDPRPGYPYNFFYRAELNNLKKLLFEHSFIFNRINEIGIRFKKFDFTGLENLRKKENIYSLAWNSKVQTDYIETLSYSNKLAKALTTGFCKSDSRFRAFYQPYLVPKELRLLDQNVRLAIQQLNYVYDISDSLQEKQELFTDIVHVNQKGNEFLADAIYAKLFNDKKIQTCIKNKLS